MMKSRRLLQKEIPEFYKFDIHENLLDYNEVLDFLIKLEEHDHFETFSYCSGRHTARPIYQIYNREFIECLAGVLKDIPDEPILEIMAGDGKLGEFLTSASGRKIILTDNKSWSRKQGGIGIPYPDSVIEMDAMEAVEKFKPALVILFWEPHGSEVGYSIMEKGIPMIWVGEGQGGACGCEELFYTKPHIILKNYPFCIGSTDYGFKPEAPTYWRCRHTEIHLFNWPKEPQGKENEAWYYDEGFQPYSYDEEE